MNARKGKSVLHVYNRERMSIFATSVVMIIQGIVAAPYWEERPITEGQDICGHNTYCTQQWRLILLSVSVTSQN